MKVFAIIKLKIQRTTHRRVLGKKMGYDISARLMQYNADNKEENKLNRGFLHFRGNGH